MPQTRPIYVSQMPEGAERYGVTPTNEQASLRPVYASQPGTELAPPSGVPYGNGQDYCTAINKKGLNCNSPKANGTEFCVGHLRQIEKLQREGNEGGKPVNLEHSKE